MFESFAPELVWFCIGLILLLGELALPAFVVIFFGIGAWLTALAVVAGIAPNIDIQLIVFLGTSLLTLILFRKKGRRLSQGRVSGLVHGMASVDTFAGAIGVVVEAIEPGQLGKVELHGTNWQAISDQAVKKGTSVEVISSDNLTLKVKPLK